MHRPIAVALTARPSYAKLKPLITALDHQGAELMILACASALLTRYGRIVDHVRGDFPHIPVEEVYSTLEGASSLTTGKDAGLLLLSVSDVVDRIRPRAMVIMADRYETLSVSMAARSQNVPVIHLQGGERSGNIDDVVRDCNTHLASYHFPATKKAECIVRLLTRDCRQVWCYGCPSIDVAKAAQLLPPVRLDGNEHGVLCGTGHAIDLNYPFILILQHPETERPEWAYLDCYHTLEGVRTSGLPALLIWPGHDAGSEDASKAIRIFINQYQDYPMHQVRGLPPDIFLRLLTQASVLVGNSSAGIRECTYLGTPVVDIGLRQFARETGKQVIHVGHQPEDIAAAIRQQIAHGPYPSNPRYGVGDAAPQIGRQILEELS